MRLLRADTFELELEITYDESTPYAILSHRWLTYEEEVKFDDITKYTRAELSRKAGWNKLQWCREQALKDGLKYVWADTACIDKSSSEELTESINSMYKWYEKSRLCYVYLNDVADSIATAPSLSISEDVRYDASSTQSEELDPGTAHSIPSTAHELIRPVGLPVEFLPSQFELGLLGFQSRGFASSLAADHSPWTRSPWTRWDRMEFSASAWFTRAWTLQEMIAPSDVRFYTRTWNYMGDMTLLADDVSQITGVDREVLLGTKSVESYSIAQKMSWAAKRKSTRLEDRAYSLLGIMGVSIPVVYTEGARAFQRLQEELLRTSSDDSIFAFEHSGEVVHVPGGPAAALLATSPSDFEGCGDVVFVDDGAKSDYEMVTKQIKFNLRIIDQSSLMLNMQFNSFLATVWMIVGSTVTLILYIITLGAWRFVQRSVSDFVASKREGMRARYVLAILRCRRARNPAVMLGLRIFPRRDHYSTFFVHGGYDRIEEIRLYQESRRSCPHREFSIIRQPAEVKGTLEHHSTTIVLESKSQNLTLMLTNPDPKALTSWQQNGHSFQVSAGTDRAGKHALPEFTADLTVFLGDQARHRVQIRMHPSNWRFFRVRFQGWALSLPDWLNWVLVRGSYYSSVKWDRQGLLVVRGFANSRPIDRRDVLFLECEHIPFISARLAYLVWARIVLAILSGLPFLLWQAAVINLALWALVDEDDPCTASLFTPDDVAKDRLGCLFQNKYLYAAMVPLEFLFLLIHLGLVADRRAPGTFAIPWKARGRRRSFLDWYLDRPSITHVD